MTNDKRQMRVKPQEQITNDTESNEKIKKLEYSKRSDVILLGYSWAIKIVSSFYKKLWSNLSDKYLYLHCS